VLIARPGSLEIDKIGVVGVLWPSKLWPDDEPGAKVGGAAGLEEPLTDTERARHLKGAFDGRGADANLAKMAKLLEAQPSDEESLREFHALLKKVVGSRVSAGDEDPDDLLLSADPIELFRQLGTPAPTAAAPDEGGAASVDLGGGSFVDAGGGSPAEGGAAGLGDTFGTLWSGAREALRAATYWSMKARGGRVGEKGLGPLIGRWQAKVPDLRVHLVGHSFGARLVSFSLAGLPAPTATAPTPIRSLTLLQGAFSHFAFAPSLPHRPGAGALAGMQERVDGPIVVTHTLLDTALSQLYPTASLAAREDAAAVADRLFRWGAMGHDGAQSVGAASAPAGEAGTSYPLTRAGFLNLDCNQVITKGGPPSGAHSDLYHPEVAWAVASAAGFVATKSRLLVPNAVLAEAITDSTERARLNLPLSEAEPFWMVIELNLRHEEGLQGAVDALFAMHGEMLAGRPRPQEVTNTYFRSKLSVMEARMLVARDEKLVPKKRCIYRVWPDFPLQPLVDRSTPTVKADAAQRAYHALGQGITWAVIDSGIDQRHLHFTHDLKGRKEGRNCLDGPVAKLHRDFTVEKDPEPGSLDPGVDTVDTALIDRFGHGSHVAGIIAGGLPVTIEATRKLLVGDHDAGSQSGTRGVEPPRVVERTVDDHTLFAGVAPDCHLVSLKVLDDQGRGQSSNILRALRYVREVLNGAGKLPIVQGVNLSVGYEFDAKWFACGQSPMCVEVDRLVKSGVVVVVAAGNTGYGTQAASARATATGMALTINDPGNADLAITVGATHRDMPHTYGVSYFSSKGPTGDGRMKPDLVAPGERITSVASGARLDGLCTSLSLPITPEVIGYVDDSGTSMAAPFVSGAIAAFLSIRREFIGQPERVKQIFMDTATPLGRAPTFEGSGLVDLMRAIGSV